MHLPECFVVEVVGELDLSGEVEEVFFAAGLDEGLEGEVEEFFGGGEVGELEGFVEQGFVNLQSNGSHGSVERVRGC